jgi:trk system potassium uptake protein TrkH
MSYARVIALGFLLIIFFGAFLLSLPISSKSGECTDFLD